MAAEKKKKLGGFFTRLSSRFQAHEPIPRAKDGAIQRREPPRLKLVFFIVDWSKVEIISGVLEEEKVRFHFISKGKGTASSEILDLLGIGAAQKAVVLCLEQALMVPVLLKEARRKLGFHSPGAGIVFTVPLSGINNPLLRAFKDSVYKNEKLAGKLKEAETNPRKTGREGENMESENKTEGKTEIRNDLVIAIVNQGYSDELMAGAREAGATGGTVLNARGLAHEGAVKFFGVSVQDEKEIVIILTSREKKLPIMKAVCEAHGIDSKAEGIVFSLPVDSVMGPEF